MWTGLASDNSLLQNFPYSCTVELGRIMSQYTSYIVLWEICCNHHVYHNERKWPYSQPPAFNPDETSFLSLHWILGQGKCLFGLIEYDGWSGFGSSHNWTSRSSLVTSFVYFSVLTPHNYCCLSKKVSVYCDYCPALLCSFVQSLSYRVMAREILNLCQSSYQC